MTLDEYMEARGIDDATFARLLQQIRKHESKPTRFMVKSWRQGKSVPTHDFKRYVEVATAGAVPMTAWRPKTRRRQEHSRLDSVASMGL